MQKSDFAGCRLSKPRYDFSFIKPADIENLNQMSSFAAVSGFFQQLHRPKQQQVEIAGETLRSSCRAQCVNEQFASILSRRAKSAAFFQDAQNRCARRDNPTGYSRKALPAHLEANLLVYTTVSLPRRQQTTFPQQYPGIRLRRKRGMYAMENDYV